MGTYQVEQHECYFIKHTKNNDSFYLKKIRNITQIENIKLAIRIVKNLD